MRTWRIAGVLVLCLMATVKSEAAVAVQWNSDLTFGSIVAVPTGGTVTISSLGGRSAVSVVPVGATFAPAAFTVTIPTGDLHYTVILPSSATLKNGNGITMTIDRFESTPASGKVDRGAGGTATFTVGGTLHVSGNQPPGAYRGTFLVMVSNP